MYTKSELIALFEYEQYCFLLLSFTLVGCLGHCWVWAFLFQFFDLANGTCYRALVHSENAGQEAGLLPCHGQLLHVQHAHAAPLLPAQAQPLPLVRVDRGLVAQPVGPAKVLLHEGFLQWLQTEAAAPALLADLEALVVRAGVNVRLETCVWVWLGPVKKCYNHVMVLSVGSPVFLFTHQSPLVKCSTCWLASPESNLWKIVHKSSPPRFSIVRDPIVARKCCSG